MLVSHLSQCCVPQEYARAAKDKAADAAAKGAQYAQDTANAATGNSGLTAEQIRHRAEEAAQRATHRAEEAVHRAHNEL